MAPRNSLANAFLRKQPQFQQTGAQSFLQPSLEGGTPLTLEEKRAQEMRNLAAQRDRRTEFAGQTNEERLAATGQLAGVESREIERQYNRAQEKTADSIEEFAQGLNLKRYKNEHAFDRLFNADYQIQAAGLSDAIPFKEQAQMTLDFARGVPASALQAAAHSQTAGIPNIGLRAMNTLRQTGGPGLGYKDYNPFRGSFMSGEFEPAYPEHDVNDEAQFQLLDWSDEPWFKALGPDEKSAAGNVGRAAGIMASFFVGSGLLGAATASRISGTGAVARIGKHLTHTGVESGVDIAKALALGLPPHEAQGVGAIRALIGLGAPVVTAPVQLLTKTLPKAAFNWLMRPVIRNIQSEADQYILHYGPDGNKSLTNADVKIIEEFRDGLANRLFDDPTLWRFTTGELQTFSQLAKNIVEKELNVSLGKAWAQWQGAGKAFPWFDKATGETGEAVAQRLLRWLPKIRQAQRGGAAGAEIPTTPLGQRADTLVKKLFRTEPSGDPVTQRMIVNPNTKQLEPVTRIRLRTPIKDEKGNITGYKITETIDDFDGIHLTDFVDDAGKLKPKYEHAQVKVSDDLVNQNTGEVLMEVQWRPVHTANRVNVQKGGVPIFKPGAIDELTPEEIREVTKIYNRMINYPDPAELALPKNAMDDLKHARASMADALKRLDPETNVRAVPLHAPEAPQFGYRAKLEELRDLQLLDDFIASTVTQPAQAVTKTAGVVAAGSANTAFGARTAAREASWPFLAAIMKGISKRSIQGTPMGRPEWWVGDKAAQFFRDAKNVLWVKPGLGKQWTRYMGGTTDEFGLPIGAGLRGWETAIVTESEGRSDVSSDASGSERRGFIPPGEL